MNDITDSSYKEMNILPYIIINNNNIDILTIKDIIQNINIDISFILKMDYKLFWQQVIEYIYITYIHNI